MKKAEVITNRNCAAASDTSLRLGRAASALLVTMLAAGCASMEGLSTRESMEDPNRLAAQKSLADAAVSAAAWPASDWWRSFGDAQLDELMQEALEGSPTLKIASARVRKALAVADMTNAGLSPRVDGAFPSPS